MQYLGGKSRISKQITSYLESIRKPNQEFHEPFCGSCSITFNMTGKRYAYDKHKQLIALWKALQSGWIPPDNVTEEMYLRAKNGEYEDHLT